MLVTDLAITGRVRFLVPVVSVAVPTAERLIKFFKNLLTGLSVEVRVAFVTLKIRLECRAVGNLAAGVPNAPCCVAGDVPELCGGETKLIETVAHLPLVPNGSAVGASDGLNRHT